MVRNGNCERRQRPGKLLVLALLLFLLAAAGLALAYPRAERIVAQMKVARLGQLQPPQWVQVQLIDVDGTSRRGERLEDLQDIVIHYVGNPGTSAEQNRNWYTRPESEVSSHFLVGLEGEILQCIPLDEKSSASNHRNRDTISIEVCHPDSSGKFSDVTYDALVELTAWLLDATGLDADHVIRHYDITGKSCPKYYVENDSSWQAFLEDITKEKP